MKSLSLVLALLTPTTAQQACLPKPRSIKLQSLTENPVSMFELLVMDENSINWASPVVNPEAVASQSSQLKEFGPENAVDGDGSTFSHTKSTTGDLEWWSVDLGNSHVVSEVIIENRWCRNPSDPQKCLCRLSQSNLMLFHENGNFITHEQLGNTCGHAKININFPRDAAFCDGEVISPADVVEAGVCQDDQNFAVSSNGENWTCNDIAAMEEGNKQLTCEEDSGLDHVNPDTLDSYQVKHFCQVTCGICEVTADDGDAVVAPAGPEPTYSPTYVPSAQPVGTIYVEGDVNRAVPTYSPAQPVTTTIEDDQLFGHAYSAGDVCEDDVNFVSDKGITCKSFVYAETVRCRSPTGQIDEKFNALRYSDFCPKTCGMCGDVAAASVSVEDNGNAKGVAIGVGLSVSVMIIILVAYLCGRSHHTGKQSIMMTNRSEFRDDPAVSESRGEFRDDVGLKKPGEEEAEEEKVAESVSEKVPETEIV